MSVTGRLVQWLVFGLLVFLILAFAQLFQIFQDPGVKWPLSWCLCVYLFAVPLLCKRRIGALRDGAGSCCGRDHCVIRWDVIWDWLRDSRVWKYWVLFFGILRCASEDSLSVRVAMLCCSAVLGNVVTGFLPTTTVFRLRLALMMVLVGSVVFVSGERGGAPFTYRGIERLSYLWNSPNVLGLLAGIGVLLEIGCLVEIWKKGYLDFDTRRGKGTSKYRLLYSGLVVAVCSWGFYMSYSRGAWFGTFLGMAFMFAASVGTGKVFVQRMMIMVMLVSCSIVAIWYVKNQDLHLAQRLASVINPVDFSWRNRIEAWRGALQITYDNFGIGAGWNRRWFLFDNYYRPFKLENGAAFELNDYFVLGSALGGVTLFVFFIYIWLSLTGGGRQSQISNFRSQISNLEFQKLEEDWLKTTCRAGAIVLLVGFWFDGGLFMLPTAATFWILLELGRGEGILTADITDNSDKKLLAEKYAK